MRRTLVLLAVLCVILVLEPASRALASDHGPKGDSLHSMDLGADAFRSGETVIVDRAGIDDLFVSGDTVDSRAALDGSAFAAGRNVAISGPVAGNAYAAGRRVHSRATIDGSGYFSGQTVDVSGAVGADLFAAGYDVSVTAAVAGDAYLMGSEIGVGTVLGDLRAMGRTLRLMGPLGGTALLRADTVEINTTITGDTWISANTLNFGPGAQINGALTLYEETPGTLDVPQSVIDPARITRLVATAQHPDMPHDAPDRGWHVVKDTLVAGLWTAVTIAIIAVLRPTTLTAMAQRVTGRALASFGAGFIVQSALLGAVVVSAATLIGLLISPVVVVVAVGAAYLGFAVAVYGGVLMLARLLGREEPMAFWAKALVGGLGGMMVSLLGMVPLFGWLLMVVLSLTGVGAIALHLRDSRQKRIV